METRASYIAVGIFVLSLMFGIVFFALWLTRFDFEGDDHYYNIYFKGSVTGLSESENVMYYGVPIGNVRKITVDPEDVERIKVTVAIENPKIIREDAIATLELKGITGLSQIQIHGSTQESPILKAKKGQKLPVISSRQSKFQQLLDKAPEIFERVLTLVDKLTDVVDKENRDNFTDFLRSAKIFTGKLADNSENVDDIFEQGKKALLSLKDAMKTVDKNVGSVGPDFKKAMDELQKLIEENRGPINDFTTSGMYELSKLIGELRDLAKSLHRVSEKVDNSPLRFLLETGKGGKVVQQ